MEQDRYAIELEKAIFNWYYCGGDAAPQSIFNAIHAGIDNDMQVLIPIETLEAMLKSMGNIEDVKAGHVFSTDEDVQIKFHHLVANERAESKESLLS